MMTEGALLEYIKKVGSFFDREQLESLRGELDFLRGKLQRGVEEIDTLLDTEPSINSP